jgi:hypothetical protein
MGGSKLCVLGTANLRLCLCVRVFLNGSDLTTLDLLFTALL